MNCLERLISIGYVALTALPTAPHFVALNIEAQPLDGALCEFSGQSDIQILFSVNVPSNSVTASRVIGTFAPESAIKQLLALAELRYDFVNARTIAIPPVSPAKPATRQFDGTHPSGDCAPETTGEPAANRAPASLETHIPEILVKGTRRPDADIQRPTDDIQPYVVLDRLWIAISAATEINDLLRTRLTMNYRVSLRYPESGTECDNDIVFDLRGLGDNQTLMLINGRRPYSQPTFDKHVLQPDLNAIPPRAIDRIEIPPITASGIYDGRATGGVVKIVLRPDYSGVEPTVAHGMPIRDKSPLVPAILPGRAKIRVHGRTKSKRITSTRKRPGKARDSHGSLCGRKARRRQEEAARWTVRLGEDPEAWIEGCSTWYTSDTRNAKAFHQIRHAWRRSNSALQINTMPARKNRITVMHDGRWAWGLDARS